LALPVVQAAGRYPAIDQSENRQARVRWEALLAEPLPSASILVSNDRDDMMPMWYFQYVDGVRPDLMGLFPLITPEVSTLGQVLDLALTTGRPVYLIKEMPGIGIKVAVETEGLLWRVVEDYSTMQPAHPLQASLAGALTLAGYDLMPPSPAPGETLRVSLYWRPQYPLQAEYHSFVHLLDASGQRIAQSDQRPGGVYYPTTLWRVGESLRDDHLLEIPLSAAGGGYTLLAGMYALAGDGSFQSLDQPVTLGQIEFEGAVPVAAEGAGTHAGLRLTHPHLLLGHGPAH
jgi:hypothetical protein